MIFTDDSRPARTVPIPQRTSTPDGIDKMVWVNLRDLQRIRDDLARLRHYAPPLRQLFAQTAALCERLSKEAGS